jgi:tRNA pseudouridine38-40 synthase
LQEGRAWHVRRRLDAEAMHAAAQSLVGRHDFTTFRAAECQAESPLRTLERLDVRRAGDIIEITTSARSFLHRQVRSIVGSLEHVGGGKWSAKDLRAALEARERARCGQVAPPHGLYLVAVDY